MHKKVVVLGGVGLIGTHLCRRLLEEGHDLYCVDTRDVASSPLLREISKLDNFHYIRHNIVSAFSIRCNEIYNLATPSQVRYDRSLPVETLKVHIEGATNTLETARTEFARVVFASSASVYSPLRRDCYTDERSDDSEQMATIEGKRAAEALHHAYAEEYDVDARIARIFNTYGSGADLCDQRVVMKMVAAALQNRDITIYGNGEQLRTFCWAGDVAEGLVLLMRNTPSQRVCTVDLGSDHEISIRALAEKIISLTGSTSRIIHTEARRNDPRSRMPDLTAARRELDWTPRTSLTEGLQRTIEYVHQQLSGNASQARTWVEMHY